MVKILYDVGRESGVNFVNWYVHWVNATETDIFHVRSVQRRSLILPQRIRERSE